jgi:uracil phosphoribosyltransferase
MNMTKTIIHTQLYNRLRELLAVMVSVTDNFPKSHRYVIGARMQELSVEALRLFAEAYQTNSPRSVALMDALLADWHTLSVLVTLAVEQGWIKGRNKSAHLIRLLDGIGKQATALRNSFASRYTKDGKQSTAGQG